MICQHTSILIWNCREVSSSGLYRTCKQYLDMYRPRILVIMETRCDPNKLEKTFQLLGSDGWCCTNIRGYAGGLVVVSIEGDVSISLAKLNIST